LSVAKGRAAAGSLIEVGLGPAGAGDAEPRIMAVWASRCKPDAGGPWYGAHQGL